MRNRRFLLVACSTAVAAAFAACSVYDSSLLVPGEGNLGGSAGDGGGGGDAQAGGGGAGGTAGDASAGGGGSGGSGGVAGDGGAGAGGSSGGGGGPTCTHATYPSPPTGTNLGDGVPDFYVAMKTVSFGDPGAAAMDAGLPDFTHVGFDLDGVCSVDPVTGPWSCKEPAWATADHTDGVDGRDSATSALISYIRTNFLATFGSDTYTSLIAAGKTSILVRVRGYNGKADDDHVQAALYIAAPFDAIDPNAGVPKWDGADSWPIASDSLQDGAGSDIDQARYVDDNAYVSGGVLVASLAKAGIRLSAGLIAGNSGDVHLNLVGAFLTGKLAEVQTPNGTQWQLDQVVLAGRWPVNDLVHQLSQFPNPAEGFSTPLCMSSPSYSLFRDIVCKYTDIYSGIGTPSVPCDAISFGIYLETAPALPGDVYTVLPAAPRCAPGLDPATDSCEGPHPVLPDGGTDADTGVTDAAPDGDAGTVPDAADD